MAPMTLPAPFLIGCWYQCRVWSFLVFLALPRKTSGLSPGALFLLNENRWSGCFVVWMMVFGQGLLVLYQTRQALGTENLDVSFKIFMIGRNSKVRFVRPV